MYQQQTTDMAPQLIGMYPCIIEWVLIFVSSTILHLIVPIYVPCSYLCYLDVVVGQLRINIFMNTPTLF